MGEGLRARGALAMGAASAMAAAVALGAPTVNAQEARTGVERVFWVGSSPGEPRAAKRNVLTGLYGLSAVSLLGTGYFAHAWYQADKELTSNTERGACYELASPECGALRESRERVVDSRFFTAVGASASLGFLLGGVLVAQYWDNAVVDLSVSPGVTFVRVSANF